MCDTAAFVQTGSVQYNNWSYCQCYGYGSIASTNAATGATAIGTAIGTTANTASTTATAIAATALLLLLRY
jgi:hypothetical protein